MENFTHRSQPQERTARSKIETQRLGKRETQSSRIQPERAALGKIQLHFEFQQSLMKKIRTAAAEANLSYSDYVRKIVGLSYPKIQRPRISLSFSSDDLQLLAERFGESEASPQQLKQRVIDEVHRFLSGSKNPAG